MRKSAPLHLLALWAAVLLTSIAAAPALPSRVSQAVASPLPTTEAALSPLPCTLSWFLPSPAVARLSSSIAGLYVQVDAWGEDSARVRIAPTPLIDNPQPQALTAQPPSSSPLSCTPLLRSPPPPQSPSSLPLRARYGNLVVELSSTGLLNVSRVTPPALLLSTTALSFTPYAWTSSFYHSPYPSYHSVNWSYTQPQGFTYGLGEHHHGREELPYRDFSIQFDFPETAGLKGDVDIPWTLHSEGGAVLWNQPGWGSFSITNSTQVTWTATQTPQFDAFFTTTSANHSQSLPPYESLLHSLLSATRSFPRPLPHYASGFWQCKLRYRSQQEVLEAAQGYVNRSLPLSVIVIDAGSWAELGDFSFDPKCFPDPAALVTQLRAIGVELMVSLWPHAGALSSNFAYMKAHGLLTANSTGGFLNESIPWMPWPPGPQPEASAVDFVAPAAQSYISDLLVKNYIAHGIRMFWLDADEPDCALPGLQWWNGRPDIEILSVYPLGVIQTVREAFDREGVTEGMVLSRDTWIGGGPMGAAVWSGDIWSEFAELRRQVLVSQNVAVSGIYHWTTDVGGFIGGVLGNATFEELAVRWFQFGASDTHAAHQHSALAVCCALFCCPHCCFSVCVCVAVFSFCPIFRTHGDRSPGLPDNACGSTGAHTEVWYFQHAEVIEGTLRLREALRPYVELHLRRASSTGRPLLTPMFYSFTDSDCYDAQEQFMFGPEWLVAPVLEERATNRSVYLPHITQEAADRLWESRDEVGSLGQTEGEEQQQQRLAQSLVWRHHYTKVEYQGGQWVVVITTLADFPLFQLTPSRLSISRSTLDSQ